MSELRSVVPTPWYRRSAFRVLVKNSLATAGGSIFSVMTGLLPWRPTLLGAAGLIIKDFCFSLYEVIYGPNESFEEPKVPDAPPAPPSPPTL